MAEETFQEADESAPREIDQPTLNDIMDAASDLADATIDDIKALLGSALDLGANPGDMAVIYQRASKATKLSAAVLQKLSLDLENAHSSGVLHNSRSVSDAIGNELRLDYIDVVHTGGLFYTYPHDTGEGDNPEVGYYTRNTHEEMDQFIVNTWWGKPAVATRGRRREAIDLFASSVERPDFFSDARKGVSVENGFLAYDEGTNTVELLAHSPEQKARYKLPIPWDPEAAAPVLMAGLARVLPDSDSVQALQEFIGCTVLGLTPKRDSARNIAILVGDARSGKSTLLHFTGMLLPNYARASIPPHRWGDDYQRSMLNGVAVNLVHELDIRTPIRGAWWKAIGACEPVTARLPHQVPLQFIPTAKHMFGANGVPKVDDSDDAIERRVVCIRFDHGLRPDEVDPHYMDRVRAELPGVFAWAVEGGLRVMERGHYVLPLCHRAVVCEMQHGDEMLVRFAAECVEKAPAGTRSLASRDLQRAYRQFMEDQGVDTTHFTPETDARRRVAVLDSLYGVEKVKIAGHPHFRGIQLKSAA